MIALVVIEREANKRNFVDTVSLHHLGLANSTFAALIGFSWTYSIGETPWVSSGKELQETCWFHMGSLETRGGGPGSSASSGSGLPATTTGDVVTGSKYPYHNPPGPTNRSACGRR